MRRSGNDEKYFGVILADFFAGLFTIMASLFVIHAVLPIAEHKPVDADQTVGIVCAELSWDSTRDVDLDLWGKSPTDIVPVGYSHTHGKNLSLLRDVIGHKDNPSGINQELMCANSEVDGEWIFNVHYFSNHAKNPDSDDPRKDDSIDVTMVLSQNGGSPHRWVAKSHLDHENEERTMFRFRVKDGLIVSDSFNTLDTELRTGEEK